MVFDIDPAFTLNREILDIRQWVGLCINRNEHLMKGLGYY